VSAAELKTSATSAPALYGLVLAGGRSTRMGQDKAALRYGAGTPQLERAVRLLEKYVVRVYVSVRGDQTADALRGRYAQIRDRHENLGPIAGLLAAQAEHPEAAWLVVACDLPLLDDATLAYLVGRRAVTRSATAFRSSHDGLPEPLCAIYEPAGTREIAAWVAAGRNCPRKFLLNAATELLTEPDPRALDNINTPEEYDSVMDLVRQRTPSAPQPARPISVQYYALLREQAGRREEQLVTAAATPAELYAELGQRYPFTLDARVLRVAINGEFREWSTPLAEGDAVVFIPPVAGG
jgi:molybdenum cofactor guanylyltransferase